MLHNIGVPGIICAFLIVLVLYGPTKLPELGRSVGKTIKEFKSSMSDIAKNEPEEKLEAKKTEVRE